MRKQENFANLRGMCRKTVGVCISYLLWWNALPQNLVVLCYFTESGHCLAGFSSLGSPSRLQSTCQLAG